MQSYRTIQDIKRRDAWLKTNGYNPSTFFSPDLEVDYIRAIAASKQLLNVFLDLLTPEQTELIQAFNSKATQKRMYRVLNLYKKIRRQLHRQSKT
jgi:23S rRNA U2552 (ribose-2'-O)-methylase RlmE/FtsJ